MRIRPLATTFGLLALVTLIVSGAWVSLQAASLWVTYDVSVADAARGALRDTTLVIARNLVSLYDPTPPLKARFAPDERDLRRYKPIEEVWRGGQIVSLANGLRLELIEARNERIVRSPWKFGYQPYDEPRIHELRQRYHLDEIIGSAPTEFEGMVRLRHWARTRFNRADYQPMMPNFDALEVLNRNYRNQGEPYSFGGHFDPCHFFQLLYAQLLVSLGHQARLVSIGEAMTEVWSNQYRKWVMMDAELDHHLERNGVPLNMLELSMLSHSHNRSGVILSRSPRSPGEENPTMPDLHVERLSAETVISWFMGPFEITELRNDWMTNHYFRGHPARSEAATLVFIAPGSAQVTFSQRLRPHTSRKEDLYWTLNQSTILVDPDVSGGFRVAFDTDTPNFDYFEVVTDGVVTKLATSSMPWQVHAGTNELRVRSVNKFGVHGIESGVKIASF